MFTRVVISRLDLTCAPSLIVTSRLTHYRLSPVLVSSLARLLPHTATPTSPDLSNLTDCWLIVTSSPSTETRLPSVLTSHEPRLILNPVPPQVRFPHNSQVSQAKQLYIASVHLSWFPIVLPVKSLHCSSTSDGRHFRLRIHFRFIK